MPFGNHDSTGITHGPSFGYELGLRLPDIQEKGLRSNALPASAGHLRQRQEAGVQAFRNFAWLWLD